MRITAHVRLNSAVIPLWIELRFGNGDEPGGQNRCEDTACPFRTTADSEKDSLARFIRPVDFFQIVYVELNRAVLERYQQPVSAKHSNSSIAELLLLYAQPLNGCRSVCT